MENELEYWDGEIVEYYMVASVLREHFDTHVDEILREIMFEMKDSGYVPIVGTERTVVLYTDKAEVVSRIEVSIQGKWYGPDAHKIEYITEDGVVTWQNTRKNKSRPSSKTSELKSQERPAQSTTDTAPSTTTGTLIHS